MTPQSSRMYGLLAEFEEPHQLVAAAERVREEGYVYAQAYTPMPVEGLAEALGFHRTRMPLVVLIGAISGGLIGYVMQYWVAVHAYPLNIGGRPLHSWPSFIPVTFEMIVLIGALSAVLGMLALNGLPRPHHPLFAVPSFARASSDGFFLCIETRDAKFDYAATRQFLQSLGAREVVDVDA